MDWNRIRNQYVRLAGGLMASLWLTGCSGGAPAVKLYQVSGLIEYQGKAVPNIIVHFVPDKGAASVGVSGTDGKFKLQYPQNRSGALPGRHKVWVEYRPKDPAEEVAVREGKGPLSPELAEAIKKYGSLQESPLTVRLKADKPDLVIALD